MTMGRPKQLKPLRALTAKEQQWVWKNKRIAYHLTWGYAWGLARRFHYNPHVGWVKQYFNELVDAALIGLCIGVQRYRKGKGASRATYSWDWVRSCLQMAMGDAVVRCGPRRQPSRMTPFSDMPHPEMDGRYSQTFDIWDHRYKPPKEESELTPELTVLMSLALNERQYRIVKRRVFEDATLEGIGDEEGVSKERVRQICNRALQKLRDTPGFIPALEKQRDRHRRHLITNDFFGVNIGTVPQPICYANKYHKTRSKSA